MLERKEPLSSGIDTYIDMIERQMEGGVWVRLSTEVLTELIEHAQTQAVHHWRSQPTSQGPSGVGLALRSQKSIQL